MAVKDGEVKMMPIYSEMSSAEKVINMAPELVEKVKSLFGKEKKQP